ncbi:MAG: hypothetical protein WDM86_12900 [Rhizomicrobium sp.]
MPLAAADAATTPASSRLRLEIWNTTMPCGDSFDRYSAKASRVSRWTGTESEANASSTRRSMPPGASFSVMRASPSTTGMFGCADGERAEQGGVLRDALHQRVQLVDRPGLAGMAVAGQGADAEPDHGDAMDVTRGARSFDRIAQRTAAKIIAERRRRPGQRFAVVVAHPLRAMHRRSVNEEVVSAAVLGQHLVDAEERPAAIDHVLAGREGAYQGEQDRGQPQLEPGLAEQHGRDGRGRDDADGIEGIAPGRTIGIERGIERAQDGREDQQARDVQPPGLRAKPAQIGPYRESAQQQKRIFDDAVEDRGRDEGGGKSRLSRRPATSRHRIPSAGQGRPAAEQHCVADHGRHEERGQVREQRHAPGECRGPQEQQSEDRQREGLDRQQPF